LSKTETDNKRGCSWRKYDRLLEGIKMVRIDPETPLWRFFEDLNTAFSFIMSSLFEEILNNTIFIFDEFINLE
jgi:hypothetical protein